MRARTWLAAAVATSVTACVPAPPMAGPSCAVGWGSQEQVVAEPMSGAPIVNVRAGVHECFDRLVVDMVGSVVPGYSVRYVDTVQQIASGDPIPLRGGAFLEIVVRAPAIDVDTGASTYPKAGQPELVDLHAFTTLEQVAWAGYQEGLTELGLGVRARLPFRVSTLQGPGDRIRVFVDVAHGW
jgi:hypothetical protein